MKIRVIHTEIFFTHNEINNENIFLQNQKRKYFLTLNILYFRYFCYFGQRYLFIIIF